MSLRSSAGECHVADSRQVVTYTYVAALYIKAVWASELKFFNVEVILQYKAHLAEGLQKF